MDERIDPIEILARVGGVTPGIGGKQRAFEVWVHHATKAGWAVAVEESLVGSAGDQCAMIDVEGLRYIVRYGRRVRHTLIDDSTGVLVERPTFAYAAWAEPVVADDLR